GVAPVDACITAYLGVTAGRDCGPHVDRRGDQPHQARKRLRGPILTAFGLEQVDLVIEVPDGVLVRGRRPAEAGCRIPRRRRTSRRGLPFPVPIAHPALHASLSRLECLGRLDRVERGPLLQRADEEGAGDDGADHNQRHDRYHQRDAALVAYAELPHGLLPGSGQRWTALRSWTNVTTLSTACCWVP